MQCLFGVGLLLAYLRWDNPPENTDITSVRIYEQCSTSSEGPDLHSPILDYHELQGIYSQWIEAVEPNLFYTYNVSLVTSQGLESDRSNTIFIIFVRPEEPKLQYTTNLGW